MKALTFLILCFASIVLADDFKTIDGKEYKNATVSRVEPDGIVLTSSSGISKVYFTELPKEVQERFHYDAAKAAAYSREQAANQEALSKQRQESQRTQAEERERYWREHATPPEPQRRSTNLAGGALDRPAYGQAAGSITPQYLVSEYAANEIKADNLYKGRIYGMSGTIKGIFQSGENITVELLVPLTLYSAGDALTLRGKVKHMCCIFNDSRGLELKQAGNPISLTGTVAGVSGDTLIIKDCHL